LYKEARPENVAFIKGTAKDEEGEPITSGTVKLKNTTTQEVTEFEVNKDDGNFSISFS
jgi:heterodisulfide reductase subunit A-like polyferredoxin